MQYTKTMIDLVFQIRKAAPAPIRSKIKLTNANLPSTLVDIYQVVDEDSLKILIYEFLTHAGTQWVQELTNLSAHATSSADRPVQVSAPVVSPPLEPNAQPVTHKHQKEKVMMYRGRPLVVPA